MITQDKEDASGSGTKIKIKSLNSLVEDNPPANSSMSDFTIGDIVEHGDFVSSDESGVMHLKITNVMSVDESITGCTVSEDDKDVFANIQIASVTTLMDDDPSCPIVENAAASSSSVSAPSATLTPSVMAVEPKSDAGTAVAAASAVADASAVVADENTTNGSVSSFKIVNLQSLTTAVGDVSAPGTKMCIVAPSTTASAAATAALPVPVNGIPKEVATKSMHYIIRSSLVVPRHCLNCYKSAVCMYRVMTIKEDDTPSNSDSSWYLCSEQCRECWTKRLPASCVLEKPRKYFERVCGMCGNDINENNKGRFSWETREFCNKLCLADHIGYVGQRCRQCQSTVRLLYMGKYCVRFGSNIYQFCSNTCLEKYKVNIQVCCYCQKNLAGITPDELLDVITVGNKKYCSVKCQRRALRKDINQQFYSEKRSCTVCTDMVVPRFEFLRNNETSYLCSQPCLNVYKFANNYKAVNCCLCLRLLCVENVTHFLYHNFGQLRVFCSTSCTNVFILSTRKIVTCCFCKVKKYNFDMIQLHDDSVNTYYCSVCCLNLHKTKNDITEDIPSDNTTQLSLPSTATLPPTVPQLPSLLAPVAEAAAVLSSSSTFLPAPSAAYAAAAGTHLSATPSAAAVVPPKAPVKPPAGQPQTAQMTQCNMCNNVSPAQFHMVMSDNTLRNFCSYTCASRYKVTFGFLVSKSNTNVGPQQHQYLHHMPKPQQPQGTQLPKPQLPQQPVPHVPQLPKPPQTLLPLTAPTAAQKETSKAPDPPASSLRAFRAVGLRSNTLTSPGQTPPATPAPDLPLEKSETECLLERIMKYMAPKQMVNKSVMCRPLKTPKDVSDKLSQCKQDDGVLKAASLTGSGGRERIFVPVPIPVYVPAPVAMYSLPTPVPIFLPVPVPVPVVLPTSADNTEAVWRTIEKLREKYGGDTSKSVMSPGICEPVFEDCDKNDMLIADPVEESQKLLESGTDKDSATEQMEEDESKDASHCEDGNLADDECEETAAAKPKPNEEKLTSSTTQMSSSASVTEELNTEMVTSNKEEKSAVRGAGDTECSGTAPTAIEETDSEKDALDKEKAFDEKISDNSKTLLQLDEPAKDESLDAATITLLNSIEDDIPCFAIVKKGGSCKTIDTNDGSRGVKRARPAEDVEPSHRKRARAEEEGENRIRLQPGLQAWLAWVRRHNKRLPSAAEAEAPQPEDLLSLHSVELNTALTLFVRQLLKPDGNMYQPDMVYYLLLGIQQHLFQHGRNYCIFLDPNFQEFNKSFDGLICEMAQRLVSAGSDASDLSTRIVEEDMWECRLLGAHTPYVLLNTLFYFNTKLFRLTTVEQHVRFTFSLIQKEWRTVDGEQCAVLKFYPNETDGESTKTDGVCYEMTENKEDPLRCPVKLYEFYLSKYHGDARSSRCPYYAYPLTSCLPESPVWYSERALTADSVRVMLHRALLVREVHQQ